MTDRPFVPIFMRALLGVSLAPLLAAIPLQAQHQHDAAKGHPEESKDIAPDAKAGGKQVMASIVSPSQPGAKGVASLSAVDGGVKLKVHVEGFAAGERGIHIHMVGKCDGPNFETAGSHWNPTQRMHGFENPKGQHMGDLPNILINGAGTGDLEYIIKGAQLSGASGALMDADGAAIVIHAARDDMKTDPSGSSGGRVACGVFGAG